MTSWLDMIVKLLLPIIGMGISAAVVFLSEWMGSRLTLGEQLLLPLIVFVVLTQFEMLVLSIWSQAQQTHEFKLWKLRNEVDQKLANIRSCFDRIVQGSYSGRDLFIDHFDREIEDLTRKINEATEKQELRVQNHHFQSVDNVMNAFLGEKEPILRYLWVLAPGEQLFDQYAWNRYFELTAEMVSNGHIRAVQGLLMVDQLDALNDARIDKLLAFYLTNKGQDCRIILRHDFEMICEDWDIPLNYIDFGIYGTRLLFRTESYDPTVGTFTKDSGLIRKYTKLFDTLWQSGTTRPNPSTTTEVVTVEILMQFDADQVVRYQEVEKQ